MASSNPIVIKKLGVGGNRGGVRIPGVFPSVRFGEQVVSTGIPSLDHSIGGGVPIGSILLIEDSFMSTCGDLILKCFLAEGASYNHHLFVASGRIPSQQFTNELPSIKKDANYGIDDSIRYGFRNETEDMKIAWRYQHEASTGGGIIKTAKKSKFEFKRKSTPQDLGGHRMNVICSQVLEEVTISTPASFADLLKEIAICVHQFKSSIGNNNLMRIAISHCEEQVFSPNFMTTLRALVRHTNSCAVLTVSTLSSNSKSLKRCEQFADTVIHLQSILDESKKVELGDLDGLCKITKLSSINSIKLVQSPKDLGFSFQRKQILFQELHLPPEGETTVQREIATSRSPVQLQPSSSNSSCGSSKEKSLEF